MSTQTTELSNNADANDNQPRPEFRPAVNILASEQAFELSVEMPGVDEEGVDVTIEKNVLTIRGRVQPPQFDGLSPIHREYGVGDYRRSFTLAEDIDPDTVEAEIRNGLLTLKLTRRQPAGPKKVKIKGATVSGN